MQSNDYTQYNKQWNSFNNQLWATTQQQFFRTTLEFPVSQFWRYFSKRFMRRGQCTVPTVCQPTCHSQLESNWNKSRKREH